MVLFRDYYGHILRPMNCWIKLLHHGFVGHSAFCCVCMHLGYCTMTRCGNGEMWDRVRINLCFTWFSSHAFLFIAFGGVGSHIWQEAYLYDVVIYFSVSLG